MLSLASADQPCSSSSPSSALPCCSSSSDEAEADTHGWPSVVNVLETPDRRRMRKTWRSVAVRVDLNKFSEPVHLSSVKNIQRPLPAIISRRHQSSFSPNKRKIGSKMSTIFTVNSADCSPSSSTAMDTQFMSPPTMRRLRHSPVLCTPKASNCSQHNHIHLSVSPMSAFFIRQRLRSGDDQSSSSPPKCSFSVLRPLNFQNYMGIRFSGEQTPKEEPRSQQTEQNFGNEWSNKTSVSPTTPSADENCVETPKQKAHSQPSSCVTSETKANSSADDSGFMDGSALSSASVIETPSKGLLTAHHPNHSDSSLSTPYACLFLGFDHQQHSQHIHQPPSCYPTTSSIPEQSYGPLEASILDGFLNDLHWPSMEAKTMGRVQMSPQNRSLLFEQKLRELETDRAGKTRTEVLRRECPISVTTRGIPSELALEMEDNAEEVTFEEIRLLLPDLEHHSFQRMFGLSTDQLELTQIAYSFIDLQCSHKRDICSLLEERATEEQRVELD